MSFLQSLTKNSQNVHLFLSQQRLPFVSYDLFFSNHSKQSKVQMLETYVRTTNQLT